MKFFFKLLLFVSALFLFEAHLTVSAQNSVSIGTQDINSKAVLWLNSPALNQGLIIPVVSNKTIVNAGATEKGMIVFDDSDKKIYCFDGITWVVVNGGGNGNTIPILSNGQILTGDGSNNKASNLTGDVTLNANSITIDDNVINSNKIVDGTIASVDLAPNLSITTSGNITSSGVATLSSLYVSGSTTLNAKTYNWPNSNAAVSTFLKNDGAGNLSWASPGNVTSVALSMPSIFSVTGSPVTTSGTLTAGLSSQGANTFLAAPDGANGTPSFRILVAADVPNLDAGKITSGTLALTNGGTGASTANAARTNLGLGGLATLSAVSSSEITDGTISNVDVATTAAIDGSKIKPDFGNQDVITTGKTIFNTTTYSWPNAQGSANTFLKNDGTGNLSWASSSNVTSVALSMPSIFSVTGSPVTTSGTLTAGLSSQGANTFFAAPDGGGGTPSFRTLVAADVPNLDAAKITSGTLTIANGGTGASTASAARTNLGLGGLATLGAVSSSEITDGAITNVDVATTAAIDGSKIKPDFGSQDVITTGKTIFNTTTYTWPNAQGSAGTFLKNDGAGNLSWATSSSSGFSTSNVIPKGNGSGLVGSTIFDDGVNVGIGTATPVVTLDVAGSINCLLDLTSNTVSAPTISCDDFSSSNNIVVPGITFPSNNKSIIHTNNSTAIDDHWLPNVSNLYNLGAATFFWKNCFLQNNPIVASDSRFKNDIVNLRYGIQDVMRLRPVSYTLKSDSDRQVKLGLIAQEVKEIVPEIVNEDNSKEKFLSMRYTELIPVLIKAIQEQQKTIATLTNELQKAKTENAASISEIRAELDKLTKAFSSTNTKSQSVISK